MNLYFRLLILRLRALRTRRRGPASFPGGRPTAWSIFRTPFRVAPLDLDQLGHMNNGRYLTILDLGRMDLMLTSGLWGRCKDLGWYPVVAAQTISYRKSLHPGERFDVVTKLLGIEDRWVFMEQSFCIGDEVHAQAIVKARFLKRSGGGVSAEELLAVAGPAPEGREVPEWVHLWSDAVKPPKTLT
ncbi:MAG: acyl-CoA thioesterase [Galactobacter sp.]|uniref:acyl-CoA thioesterase n=1 Tax=Galactobacter sp. TaxID=2676125 RepID=UPI0025C29ABA|nr:acyl-CoA thioesterase [Galactobacter sp.]